MCVCVCEFCMSANFLLKNMCLSGIFTSFFAHLLGNFSFLFISFSLYTGYLLKLSTFMCVCVCDFLLTCLFYWGIHACLPYLLAFWHVFGRICFFPSFPHLVYIKDIYFIFRLLCVCVLCADFCIPAYFFTENCNFSFFLMSFPFSSLLMLQRISSTKKWHV